MFLKGPAAQGAEPTLESHERHGGGLSQTEDDRGQ